MTTGNKPTANLDALTSESIGEKQAQLLTVVLGVLNVLTVFAAPRCLERMDPGTTPDHKEIVVLFDEFLALFDKPEHSSKDARTLIPAREIRKQLDNWPITRVAPRAVITSARELLAGLGVPEPDEGWDFWEPAPDE